MSEKKHQQLQQQPQPETMAVAAGTRRCSNSRISRGGNKKENSRKNQNFMFYYQA